ncbi:MAG TPA: hypothetical protein PKC14_00945 [Candidatus Absconditabacterales bacterium]|nr:hypothetical protein [Candidatus Absconditabacterales bacterium]
MLNLLKKFNFLQNTGYINYHISQVRSVVTKAMLSRDFSHQKLISPALDEAIELLSLPAQLIVGSDETSQLQFAQELDSLIVLLQSRSAKNIYAHQLDQILEIVQDYQKNRSSGFAKVSISAGKIEKIFGVHGLFYSAPKLLTHTLFLPQKIKKNFYLSSDRGTISPAEIKKITNFFFKNFFGKIPKKIKFCEEKNPQLRRLARHDLGDSIYYLFKQDYLLTDFLIYELPHNLVHLFHLSTLVSQGKSYRDRPDQRAFFEAVALLGESAFQEKILKDPKFSQGLYDCLDRSSRPQISREEFRDFILFHRIQENQLRAVRLFSDLSFTHQKSIHQSLAFLQQKTKISDASLLSELKKYSSQPGLGGSYTRGLSKLHELGFTHPSQIFHTSSSPSTRSDFLISSGIGKNNFLGNVTFSHPLSYFY